MKSLWRCGGLLALFTVVAALAVPAHADDAGGSFRAIMAAKSPGTFGSHPVVAGDAPFAQDSAPAAGSFQALMAAKSPGRFGAHLAAADEAPTVLASSDCGVNGFATLMSAKLPPNARPGGAGLYGVKCQGSAGLW